MKETGTGLEILQFLFYFHNYLRSRFYHHCFAKEEIGLERAGQWFQVTRPGKADGSHFVFPLWGLEAELPQARLLDPFTTHPGCLSRELCKTSVLGILFAAEPRGLCDPSMCLPRAHFPSPPCLSVSHFFNFCFLEFHSVRRKSFLLSDLRLPLQIICRSVPETFRAILLFEY